MCGIAGIVSSDQLRPDACTRALRMRDVLAHRGPDEVGMYCDGVAALAHRRLNIVDLATGQQPMSNEQRDTWVVFNGEIYNHTDIRQDLERRGHEYRTRSDTESIVHAYEQWGDECVHKFRGMFAFAIWDRPKRRLLLARDRLGIKPLYWTTVGDVLLFGSEIKAILASGLVQPKAHLAMLPQVLGSRYTSGAETLYAGIQKLLPGHRLVFENGRASVEQYWDLPVDGVQTTLRKEDIVDRFRELLGESVRIHLMSDVPVGMLLSGGLDSSAIAAIMAQSTGPRLHTFSVAFKETAFNELEYARTVSRAIGANAHEIVIDDRDFFDALPRLVWHEDEPLAHPSSVPLYFVSKLAREHVTVVLTGEGSDELLGGYGKYPRVVANWRAGRLWSQLLPQALRRVVAERIARVSSMGRVGRLGARSFLAMDCTPEAMVFDNFAAIRVADQQNVLAPELRSLATLTGTYAGAAALFNRPGANRSLLDRLLYADVKTYLVELLMKQDQMSMAASIESRVPFLDHELVEFCASLPDQWKLSGWKTKRILREAMKPLVPPVVISRPKMGFPVPFSSWTSGTWNPVMCDVLLDRRTRERGIFDAPAVERLLLEHRTGKAERGDWIWSLFNLELWFRTSIDQQGIQTLPAAARA